MLLNLSWDATVHSRQRFKKASPRQGKAGPVAKETRAARSCRHRDGTLFQAHPEAPAEMSLVFLARTRMVRRMRLRRDGRPGVGLSWTIP
jgi:hypothetical protein